MSTIQPGESQPSSEEGMSTPTLSRNVGAIKAVLETCGRDTFRLSHD
ncbi:hypothetical protein HYV57_04595 [Candidatus Peregrinibacteria bacterium]|nr:hypothetical protein [Candidatus Peregrinibacteria bacterium]